MTATEGTGSMARLGAEFFAWFTRTHPEEATTLGVGAVSDGAVATDVRWRDLSSGGLAAERAYLRDVVRQLDALPGPDAANPEESLDRWAIGALARYLLHAEETRDATRSNLELSLLPYQVLQHQLHRARSPEAFRAVAARAAAIPEYLAQHARNLRDALDEGASPDRDTLAFVLEHQIEASASSLESLARAAVGAGHALSSELHAELDAAGRAAASALREHAATLREAVLPRAVPTAVIGEREYALRLKTFWQLEHSLDELTREARAALATAHDQLAQLAARLAPRYGLAGGAVRTLAEVREVFERVTAERPAPDEVIALYERLGARAEAFIREKGLFHLPAYLELRVRAIPPGMVPGTNATNWPAPLLDPRGAGHVLVAPDPAWHSLVSAANLSVHEGIPGHYLQSAAFQSAFARHPAPVRFLLVADDLAIAHRYFAPMLSIEGYAVYAEQLMLREGYYTEAESVMALVSEAIRAVRVIVDIGLHTGAMSPDEACAFIAENTPLPARWARSQVERYLRIPLQAIAYHVGAREVWALRAHAQAHAGARFNDADFHAALFALGPVPPALGRAALTQRMSQP